MKKRFILLGLFASVFMLAVCQNKNTHPLHKRSFFAEKNKLTG